MQRHCCRDPHGTEGGAAASLPQPPSPLSFFPIDRLIHNAHERDCALMWRHTNSFFTIHENQK